MAPPLDVNDPAYAERLMRLEGRWWKRVLDVQRPYRWYLRRMKLGSVLDVGCGVGRSLINSGGHGVGVDVSARAVELTRRRGLTAYMAAEFLATDEAQARRFDTLLLAHVVEHMSFDDAEALVGQYLPFVKPGGRVVIITPQEAGFASDPTHERFFDWADIEQLMSRHGVAPQRRDSFPLPRPFGRVFLHNEFVVVGKLPA